MRSFLEACDFLAEGILPDFSGADVNRQDS